METLSEIQPGSPQKRHRVSTLPPEDSYFRQILTDQQHQLLNEIRGGSGKASPSQAAKFEPQTARKSLQQSNIPPGSPNRLYKNAMQKLQNQHVIAEMARQFAINQASAPKISKGSYRIIQKKNEQSLQRALSEVDPEDIRMLSYEKLGRVLTLLQIFRVLEYNHELVLEPSQCSYSENILKRRVHEMNLHQSTWSVVTGGQDVPQCDIEPVYLVLKILIEPSVVSVAKRSQHIVSVLVGYWQSQVQGEECYERINAESVINLVRIFKDLQRDRLAFEKIGYFKVNKFAEIVTEEKGKFTFKPKVEQRQNHSIDHDDDSGLTNRQKLPLFLRVEERQKEKQAKLQALRKEKKQKQLEGCTFRPKLSDNYYPPPGQSLFEPSLLDRLYQFESVKEKSMKEKVTKKERQLAQLQKCTFKPKTSFRKVPPSRLEEVPGYQKAVGRLRYANNLNKMKKYQQEHISTGQNYKGPGSYKIQAPSFLNRKKKKKEPYLYVEVNMGAGKVGRIGVSEGDDPALLSQNFCKIYGLGASVQNEIQDLLQEQMQLQEGDQQQQDSNSFPFQQSESELYDL